MKNALPTVDIKGKEYVLVKDRILAFNTEYKNGYIQTELVSSPDSKTIIVRAIVTPDASVPERKFIDYSQSVVGQGVVNMTAALENASTSAVGRALAYMGIGVIESIASADEVRKATNAPNSEPQRATSDSPMCQIHNKLMKERAAPNGGHYFDHRWQDESGEWQKCNGSIKKNENVDPSEVDPNF